MKKIVILATVMAIALVGLGIGTVAMGQEADGPASDTDECPKMGEGNQREMHRAMMINDLDSDGIPNCEDPDDDGDGVNDSEDEYPHDHDNDGIPDGRDDDDDNDGIPDSEDDDYVGNPPKIPYKMQRRNHMRENRGKRLRFQGQPPAEGEP